MGRELRDRELKVVVAQLEDCSQSTLLLFMMEACLNAEFLDKVGIPLYNSDFNEVLHISYLISSVKMSHHQFFQAVDCVFNNENAIIVSLKLHSQRESEILDSIQFNYEFPEFYNRG